MVARRLTRIPSPNIGKRPDRHHPAGLGAKANCLAKYRHSVGAVGAFDSELCLEDACIRRRIRARFLRHAEPSARRNRQLRTAHGFCRSPITGDLHVGDRGYPDFATQPIDFQSVRSENQVQESRRCGLPHTPGTGVIWKSASEPARFGTPTCQRQSYC
jgi:hypothetical protein